MTPRSDAVPALGLLLWNAMIFLELPPECTAVSKSGSPFMTLENERARSAESER